MPTTMTERENILYQITLICAPHMTNEEMETVFSLIVDYVKLHVAEHSEEIKKVIAKYDFFPKGSKSQWP
jgi:hypothetical protein